LLTAPFLLHGQNEDDEDITTLSPFTIEENDSVGYQATNTLAGSRLKTPLRDVGSAIQVITAELFEDTGSTSMEEILPYALNMESHGVLGNFAGGPGQNHNGRYEQDNQRINPSSAQRVRGLSPASLTRNFFLTDIPFESYNTQRITISRGANSLLFGIGAPGGIINNSTKRSSVDGEDFGEVSVRFGERSSHRENFDVHKILIEDRLAVRVMGLHKDTQYQQRPAYEIDKRVTAALEAVLFENDGVDWLGRTKARFNYERGEIEGAPPNLVPPTDAFSSFFQPPDVALLQTIPGVVVPGFYPGGLGVSGTGATEATRFHPEFGYTHWQAKQTFDNRVGLSRGNVPAVTERGFHRIKIKFDHDSDGPIPYGVNDGTQFFASPGNESGATGYVDEFGYPTPNGTHALGIDGNPYPVLSSKFAYIESGSFFMGNRNDQRIPNFTTPVILNKDVWDNEDRMIQGRTQVRIMDFEAETFVLEQPLLNGEAGIEFVWDNQTFDREATIPFSEQETIGDSGNGDVVIDINEYLINGTPNPNLGRPMMKTDEYPGRQFSQVERESSRWTGFYNVDFENIFGEDSILKWLGRHTVTGLYNKQTIDSFNHTNQARLRGKTTFLGESEYLNRTKSGIRDGNFRPVYEVYLGPDVRGFSDPSQVQLNMMNFVEPEAGDAYPILLWNRDTQSFDTDFAVVEDVLVGGSRRRNEVVTEVVSVQSRFLDDHIVGLIGWRDDTSTTWENINSTEGAGLGITRDMAGSNSPRNPDYFRVSENSSSANGDTVTWSVVGHVPDEWLGNNFGMSVHVSESENFQVSPTRRDVLGNVLGPPIGTTEEYGVTFNLFQNKLIAKLNWFETSAAGATISGGTAFDFYGWIRGYLTRWYEASEEFDTEDDPFQAAIQASIDQLGPGAGDLDNPNFQSFGDVYDEIISWLPSEIQSQRNLRIDPASGELLDEPNPGQTSTQDFVTEGFEVDLTANITDNWRLFMNLGQQESVRSNIALAIRDVSTTVFNNIKASPIGQWADTPARSEGQTFESRFLAIVGAPLGKIAAQDGQLAQELREWRLNAGTLYSFNEGILSGFSAGGAVRWQDNNAIGYPNMFNADGEIIPDLAKPFMGPDQLNGDIFASYQRPIFDDKIDWKIQLNVRNAFGDDDYIPIAVNPDGRIAAVRNSQPMEIFVTNTFRF
jgi:outer membrane receptor protein involved in Fe transport